ncbi:putative NUDIX family NTP pyrophosphohydrolase [Bradyrhizobium sp. OAE829]
MAAPNWSTAELPEVDRAEWFDIDLARTKMLSAQVELLDRLLAIAAESTIK